jgi:hypothetical protein
MRAPGLDPRSGGTGGGTPVPVAGDPLVVRAGDHVVATAVTAPDGSFATSVPAGTVTLVESICGVSQTVQVGAGETVEITISVPNSC